MTSTADTPPTGAALLATRVVTAATVAVLLLLFATAGALFPRGGPEDLHGTGAVLLHITSGLSVLAVFWLRRTVGGPWWPTVLAAVVFALGFLQAQVGERSSLDLHVPGALLVSVGAVWLTAWAFTGAGGSARTKAAQANH